MVFDGGGDDVISFVLVSIGDTLQSIVIRLRSSAGKDNLLAPSTDKFRHLGSGFFQGPLCFLSVRIDAGRIAEGIAEERQHGLHYFMVSWRGGSVVQIYPSHLTFYNISRNRVNSYPFAGHPDNSPLDVFSFSLQLKNYPAFISVYIGTADISHYFEPLTKVVNDGLLDQSLIDRK